MPALSRIVPRMLLALLGARCACAQEAPPAEQTYAVHGQWTTVAQGVAGIASPYAGDNSLAGHQLKATNDVTLYLGVRPWRGAEIWVNPELDQGFGLSNTLGVAGFPSAEAYKVGKTNPYFKLQRAFLRQTIALGGAHQSTDAAPNQLRGNTTDDRIVITVGKLSVVDIFDTNKFAHDPRGDFLNWSIVDTGSFDYAANAWGYSYGVATEWYTGPWTFRAGLFSLSKVPNGTDLDATFRQNQIVIEAERRFEIGGRGGAIRLTGYRNRGMFARFDEALAAPRPAGQVPDLAVVRRRQSRQGIAMNIEQSVAGNFGIFARAGVSEGSVETYDFTDIDQTFALGGSWTGGLFGRKQDTFAVAAVVNGIAPAHVRWLAAGGLGVLVGDGALPHPANEKILEAYYELHLTSWSTFTLDVQHVANPGYNRDRGPANIVGVRAHFGV